MPTPTNGEKLKTTKVSRKGLLTVQDVLGETPMTELTEVKTSLQRSS